MKFLTKSLIPQLAPLLVSVLVLLSCGQIFDVKDKSRRDITRGLVTSEYPATYELFDQGCIESSEQIQIRRTAVWGWNGFGVTNETTLLQDTATRLTLESSIVAQTTFNRRYIRVCPGPNEVNCVHPDGRTIGWKVPDESNPLRVCRDNFTYPRESYEGSALTSVHYLNEAAAAYRAATQKQLRPIKLEVFPLFESQFFGRTDMDGNSVDVREFIVDNLAYFPGNDLIAVFPQSAMTAEKDFDKFWESSFVLAHELGHHIEEIHVGAELRQQGLYWDPHLHGYRSIAGSTDQSDLAHKSKLQKYWTTVSEAFADLNAYYARNEDVTTLANLDCLGANRNLTSGIFADKQTEKILTRSVAQQLLNGSSNINYCDSVDLAEPHTVGAVLAHNMKQIIAILEPSSDAQPDQETVRARYRRSIKWLESMVAVHKQDKERDINSYNLFNPLTNAIERLANDASKLQKQRICRLSAERLPALESPPFADYCQKL